MARVGHKTVFLLVPFLFLAHQSALWIQSGNDPMEELREFLIGASVVELVR